MQMSGCASIMASDWIWSKFWTSNADELNKLQNYKKFNNYKFNYLIVSVCWHRVWAVPSGTAGPGFLGQDHQFPWRTNHSRSKQINRPIISELLNRPITADLNQYTDQSQQIWTDQQTNHSRSEQINRPITADLNRSTDQSQQIWTDQQTNHSRSEQINRPITADLNRSTDQSLQIWTDQQTNHSRSEQINRPITANLNRSTDQSQQIGTSL